GKPIAWDSVANLILQQLGVLDGTSANAFASESVRNALHYVARVVSSIFLEPGVACTVSTPVSRIYLHWSGIVLKLRGVRMTSLDGREYTTVLVERGETIAAKQRRLQFRWGLSDREAEVLALIGQGKTGPEIGVILNIRHDTVRK